PGRAAVLTVLCLTAAVMIRLDQRYPLTAALVMIGATAIALVTSNIKLADRFATVSIALLACTLVLSFGVSFRSSWAHRFRLNADIPIRDESFDAISSNQVIEHLSDTDIFLAESFRVLRPGGHVVVSTENMSSWHNLAALLLGWQAFSLTNITDKRSGIGNP